MEDIQKFKKLIDENYNSPSKRVLADLVLLCIEKIDKLQTKIDNLSVSSNTLSPKPHIGFLKEVNTTGKGEIHNVNNGTTSK